MENNSTNNTPDDRSGPRDSDVLPNAESRRRPVFDPTGKVESLMNDEVRVADVRRHPVGLFIIYLQFLFGLGAAFFVIFVLLPSILSVVNITGAQANTIASLFAVFVAFLSLIFLVLASRIYRGNQLIVSDVNVTQVLQVGLFNRKVSELSMHNVEDVTAQQKGLLQTFFNYGTLTIETAGEQNNFIFVYCPNPNAYAKAILDSRQVFVRGHPKNS